MDEKFWGDDESLFFGCGGGCFFCLVDGLCVFLYLLFGVGWPSEISLGVVGMKDVIRVCEGGLSEIKLKKRLCWSKVSKKIVVCLGGEI